MSSFDRWTDYLAARRKLDADVQRFLVEHRWRCAMRRAAQTDMRAL